MMKMIERFEAFTPVVKNALYKEGYRYVVAGNYEILDSIDHLSGMPNVSNNFYVFSDKTEAEEFALTQELPFSNGCPKVHDIPEHTETWEDICRKYAEERAKKEAKEKEKAEKAGMTLEEYKEFKKLEAKKRKYTREIAKMKEEIENLKKEIEKKENFLKNH